MKICAISDLHGYLPKIDKCDYLLICGDISPLDIQKDIAKAILWFTQDFVKWCNSIDCKNIFIIAGNHDFIIDYDVVVMEAVEIATKDKVIYLNNNYYGNKDIDIFGTQYCHKFGGWPFMLSDKGLVDKWKNEVHADIMICHDTPSFGNLDLDINLNKHIGNKPLADLIRRVKPRYVFCGHLHSCKDKHITIGNTEIYNVSLLDNRYIPVYEPLYLEISK